jgi:hypothetical protein
MAKIRGLLLLVEEEHLASLIVAFHKMERLVMRVERVVLWACYQYLAEEYQILDDL